jgi:small subunit ribosomal protein S11
VKADAAAAARRGKSQAEKEKAALAGRCLPRLPPLPAAPAEPAAPVVPTAADLLGEDPNAKKIVKAKHAKNISVGIANILGHFQQHPRSASRDMQGNVIGWSRAGRVGFKGSRKSTAYAAQLVAQDAARQAMSHGMKEVEIRVQGSRLRS